MRPVYIRMSAFGPYAGIQELNMEELGAGGLYLITGDTGAGKTTILMPLHLRYMEKPVLQLIKKVEQSCRVSLPQQAQSLMWN